ncbi:hypothetical protein [Terricaulis sp.]|uniref:DUF4760 domain-containing protein n=1 Tax=Terricaulis sp. TaxID=2768686 RepID=UPI002AC5CB3D|nr:hypothetical protein [Terricaulis sp.]MDZ4691666.1 hypothetical protein [Terricaulis sp.]
MTIELFLQIVQTLAVVVGGLFAVDQLRQMRLQREIQTGAELLRSMQSPLTASTALMVVELPDNLSTAELKAATGDKFADVLYLCAVFESMGPLIARGHLSIDYYADFYRGATVLCWKKLQRYTEEQRANGFSNLFEWFQWLAERLEARTPSIDASAQVQFADWKSPADYQRLRFRSND